MSSTSRISHSIRRFISILATSEALDHACSMSAENAAQGLGGPDRNVRARPRDKRGRLPAGYSVRERNSIRPVRAQIRVRFEVPERVCQFGWKTVLRDLMEGELVTLSIQGADDFIEAHEIPDQWQVLAVAGLIRERKCSGDDVAEFTNITHVNATDARIERKCPAH